MDVPVRQDLEELLAHSDWLRRLARGLVADPHAADDAAQETWLAALTHGDPNGGSRAWLATVLRNVVRQARRGSARRVEREASAAREERLPPAGDVVAGLALQQELARAVLALDEPYRTTIYERFYAGLAPREIARRHGVPVKTVKTRLARGLETLRARLDREHGDRAKWLSALVPFLGREGAALTLIGALLMNSKLKLALVLVALAALTWTIVERRDASPNASGRETTSAFTPRDETPKASSEFVTSTPASARTAAEAPTPVTSSVVVAQEPAQLVGRVIDLGGAPVPDVDVCDADSKTGRNVLARASADGTFTLPVRATNDAPGQFRNLGIDDAHWVDVFEAYVYGTSAAAKPTIVVAPRNALAGRIVDREHTPVEGAEVHIELDPALRRDLGEILDSTMVHGWVAKSDALGNFALGDAPRAKGELVVESPAHSVWRQPLPDAPNENLEIVLERPEEPHVVIAGIVVDPHGARVAGASIALGNRTSKSDAEGRFRIDVSVSGKSDFAERNADGVFVVLDDRSRVVAVKAGHLPAIVELPTGPELATWPDAQNLVLRLGEKPLAITGVVEDAEGKRLPGVTVAIVEGTRFGLIGLNDGQSHVSFEATIEELLNGSQNGAKATSDAEGRFELGGLLDRDYDLSVIEETTLRRTALQAIRGGATGVVVRLASSAACRRIAGRVASPTGEPIAGVVVLAGSRSTEGRVQTGASVTTDVEGRFEFAALLTEGLGFQVYSETTFMSWFRELRDDDDPEHMTITLSRRCYVQVDLGQRKELADRCVALDENGNPVRVMEFADAAIFFPDEVELHEGKSEVIAVEETCRWIQLLAKGVEVSRVPVAPIAGERVVVRP